MRSHSTQRVCWSIVTAIVAIISSASYADPVTHEVTVRNFEFDPAVIEINQGDSVLWIWESGFHTVTSGFECVADGLFNSPINADNPQFLFTFSDLGEFPYFCQPHCSFPMAGVVVVLSSGTGGACCDIFGGECYEVSNPTDCFGEYKGEGTDCSDWDDDGLPDVMETGDCSAPQDPCNVGTVPGIPDTDNDGCLDGVEFYSGSDPCDPCSYLEFCMSVEVDCNSNGIPDACEPDLNSNGIPDDCDIAECRSNDLNHNGIPDEVDIAEGTAQDANTNGIIDEAEQPDDEHSAIPMQDGVIRDSDFAEKLAGLLINSNGEANAKDVKVFFQQCFGGGMLDDIAEALGDTVPWVGGSASRHDEPSWGENDDEDNPDEPLNRWTRPLRDALKEGTVLRALKRAAREDAANPQNRNNKTERPQYRFSDDDARDITLEDPDAASHHAVMIAGYPDRQRHRNNIREMCELLKEEWGNLNTNGTSVHVLFGDGSVNPCESSGVPAENVSAATTNGLDAVLEALRDVMGDDEEFVLYVSDHGSWLTDAEATGDKVLRAGPAGTEFTFDLPQSVHYAMIRERYNQPFITVTASGSCPPNTVPVLLNGRQIGYLDPSSSDATMQTETVLIISDHAVDAGINTVAIDPLAAPGVALEAVQFSAGLISIMIEFGWGDTNGDGDVDLDDLTAFQNCLTGPGGGWPTPTCGYSDIDEDGDIDLQDFQLFQQVFTGSL